MPNLARDSALQAVRTVISKIQSYDDLGIRIENENGLTSMQLEKASPAHFFDVVFPKKHDEDYRITRWISRAVGVRELQEDRTARNIHCLPTVKGTTEDVVLGKKRLRYLFYEV